MLFLWCGQSCRKLLQTAVIFSCVELECACFNLSILSAALSARGGHSYPALITEVFTCRSFLAGQQPTQEWDRTTRACRRCRRGWRTSCCNLGAIEGVKWRVRSRFRNIPISNEVELNCCFGLVWFLSTDFTERCLCGGGFPSPMQNLLLSGSRSSTDASRRVCVTELEVGGMSAGENGCNSNAGTNDEGITHLEVTQQSLPALNSDSWSCEGFGEGGCTSAPSASWGEFEGFREPLGRWQRSHPSADVLLKSKNASGDGTDVSRGHRSAAAGHFCSEPSLHSATQEASSSLNEVSVHSEAKTRSVCVTASFRFVSECLLYREQRRAGRGTVRLLFS